MDNFSRDWHDGGRDEAYRLMVWGELAGISDFRPDHVKNARRLVAKLREPADVPTRHVATRLPAFVRERLLAADPAEPVAPLLPTVLTGFDLLQWGPPLYDAQSHSGLSLPREGKELLGQKPAGGDELARLNRLVLEATFPEELRRTKGLEDSLGEMVLHARGLMHGKVVRGVRDGEGDKEAYDFAMDTIALIVEGRRLWNPMRRKSASLLWFAKNCVMRSEVNHWLERSDNARVEHLDPTREDGDDHDEEGEESPRAGERGVNGPPADDVESDENQA